MRGWDVAFELQKVNLHCKNSGPHMSATGQLETRSVACARPPLASVAA